MLTGLELSGFKSFADRTRFDFPEGTTVVVGPNGSGKSNIVDAVKWVLGSQSAKSLRGKEMADVIFSGSKGRRPAGAAEVSLSLREAATSNADQQTAEELAVKVTRRVLRSGESDYLLNGQSCRLRDIQDKLADLKVSSGSYCIIEQGKVDAVLQQTPLERRSLFEEAAGISRFRVKRKEAARRLIQIDQNLLRLADLFEEVDSRVKSIRAQANRARRFNELDARRRDLLQQIAVSQWRDVQSQIRASEARKTAAVAESTARKEELSSCEQELQETEAAARELQEQLRKAVAQDMADRERIVKLEARRTTLLARSEDLEREVDGLGRQTIQLTQRLESAATQLTAVDSQLAVRVAEFERLQQDADARVAEHNRCLTQLQECCDAHEAVKTELVTLESETPELRRQIAVLARDLESTQQSLSRANQDLEPAVAEQNRVADEVAAIAVELTAAEASLGKTTSEHEHLECELDDQRSAKQRTDKHLAETLRRRAGVVERIAVLEEVENRLGGVGAGTREALLRAAEHNAGALAGVKGLVADLLHVDADMAPLIEIALGELATYLVVEDGSALVYQICKSSESWPHRASFLRLDVQAPAAAVDRVDLSNENGVVGRADTFVEAEPELDSLVRRLLRRFWLVDSLTTAMSLSTTTGRGLSFITLEGELVSADGVLTIGPHAPTKGALSRRSEIDQLQNLAEELNKTTTELTAETQRIEAGIAELEERTREALKKQREAQQTHNTLLLEQANAREKLDNYEQRVQAVQEQLDSLNEIASKIAGKLTAHEAQAEESHGKQEGLRQQLTSTTKKKHALETQLQALRQANTEARIELARCEQSRAGLYVQNEQLADEVAERQLGLAEKRDRLNSCRKQLSAAVTEALELASELATLYSRKDASQQQAAELDELRRRTEQLQTTLRRKTIEFQRRAHAADKNVQSLESELQQLQQRAAALAERTAGECNVNLASLTESASNQPNLDHEEVVAAQAELQELQRQLGQEGSVNQNAINELDALEQRHTALRTQQEDMEAARTTLKQVSEKANAKCRELYIETIEDIRRHFQEVFRALFGGGESDIVLDEIENGDVFEAGVSIVARPPGKQPRSISLLSGGEKTLTCVALLLAIFRSRPSPFCILDEVDAALDESNIDRFLTVLRDYMGATQFIVVTHSKRTMACADTLYGVTMQESGVSKLVSVRLEDVGKHGEIRASDSQRAAA